MGQNNWTNLSTFFEYDEQVRKTIYTTNPIEGMHCQVRKITKSKGAFSSEQALMKLM
ncbi:transposase [Sphingobacterium faecium]